MVEKAPTPPQTRRVDGNKVVPLWETDRWNGTLAGVCSYNGQPFYFKGDVGNPRDERRRRFDLHPLSEDQFKSLKETHEAFRQLVGDYCDFETDWTTRQGLVKPTWGRFFEEHPDGVLGVVDTKKAPAPFYFYIPQNKDS